MEEFWLCVAVVESRDFVATETLLPFEEIRAGKVTPKRDGLKPVSSSVLSGPSELGHISLLP